MFKLPKNDPQDVEFIKKAHQDPNWPEDLDKPCDWDEVSLFGKIWFRIGNTVKTIFAFVCFIAFWLIFALIFGSHSDENPLEEYELRQFQIEEELEYREQDEED
jgi:hypothetical protein